jgi:hypothetical protein
VLRYQVVEPGKYIDLKDPRYESDWTGVELKKAEGTDAGNPQATLAASLPGKLQENRCLVRYRVCSSGDGFRRRSAQG